MFLLTVIIVAVAAAAFAYAGYTKVSGAEQRKATAEHLRIEWPAYRLIGVAELLGAAGLVVGLWLSWLGIVAAVCLVILVAGAITVHARVGDEIAVMRPAIGHGVLAVLALIFRVLTV